MGPGLPPLRVGTGSGPVLPRPNLPPLNSPSTWIGQHTMPRPPLHFGGLTSPTYSQPSPSTAMGNLQRETQTFTPQAPPAPPPPPPIPNPPPQPGLLALCSRCWRVNDARERRECPVCKGPVKFRDPGDAPLPWAGCARALFARLLSGEPDSHDAGVWLDHRGDVLSAEAVAGPPDAGDEEGGCGATPRCETDLVDLTADDASQCDKGSEAVVKPDDTTAKPEPAEPATEVAAKCLFEDVTKTESVEEKNEDEHREDKSGPRRVWRREEVDDEAVASLIESWASFRRIAPLLSLPRVSLASFLAAIGGPAGHSPPIWPPPPNGSQDNQGSDGVSADGSSPEKEKLKSNDTDFGSVGLLDYIHVSLIRRALDLMRASDRHVKLLTMVNVLTWPEAMRTLLEWRAGSSASYRESALGCPPGAANEEPSSARTERHEEMVIGLEDERATALRVAKNLGQGPYHKLPINDRIFVLKYLLEQVWRDIALKGPMDAEVERETWIAMGAHRATNSASGPTPEQALAILRQSSIEVLNTLEKEFQVVSACAHIKPASASPAGSGGQPLGPLIRHLSQLNAVVRPSTAVVLDGPPRAKLVGEVRIAGLANGSSLPLPSSSESLESPPRGQPGEVMANQTPPLLAGWTEVRRRRAYAVQGDSGPDPEHLLLSADMLSTSEGRRRHLQSVLAAFAHVLAQFDEMRAEIEPRVEPGGSDRHGRQWLRMCGEMERVFLIWPQSGRWGYYSGARMLEAVDSLRLRSIVEFWRERALWHKMARPAHLVASIHGGISASGPRPVLSLPLPARPQPKIDGVTRRLWDGGLCGEEFVAREEGESLVDETGETYQPRSSWVCNLTHLVFERPGRSPSRSTSGTADSDPPDAPSSSLGKNKWRQDLDELRSSIDSAPGGRNAALARFRAALLAAAAAFARYLASSETAHSTSASAEEEQTTTDDSPIKWATDCVTAAEVAAAWRSAIQPDTLATSSEKSDKARGSSVEALLRLAGPAAPAATGRGFSICWWWEEGWEGPGGPGDWRVSSLELLEALEAVVNQKPRSLPWELRGTKRRLLDLESAIHQDSMPSFVPHRRSYWMHLVKFASTAEELMVAVLYFETCLERHWKPRWRPFTRELKSSLSSPRIASPEIPSNVLDHPATSPLAPPALSEECSESVPMELAETEKKEAEECADYGTVKEVGVAMTETTVFKGSVGTANSDREGDSRKSGAEETVEAQIPQVDGHDEPERRRPQPPARPAPSKLPNIPKLNNASGASSGTSSPASGGTAGAGSGSKRSKEGGTVVAVVDLASEEMADTSPLPRARPARKRVWSAGDDSPPAAPHQAAPTSSSRRKEDNARRSGDGSKKRASQEAVGVARDSPEADASESEGSDADAGKHEARSGSGAPSSRRAEADSKVDSKNGGGQKAGAATAGDGSNGSGGGGVSKKRRTDDAEIVAQLDAVAPRRAAPVASNTVVAASSRRANNAAPDHGRSVSDDAALAKTLQDEEDEEDAMSLSKRTRSWRPPAALGGGGAGSAEAAGRAEERRVRAAEREEELRRVLRREYEVAGVSCTAAGIAGLVHLIDAGYDFDWAHRPSQRISLPAIGYSSSGPTYGTERQGKLVWIRGAAAAPGGAPAIGEITVPADKGIKLRDGMTLVQLMVTRENIWADDEVCVDFEQALYRFQGECRTSAEQKALQEALARLDDLKEYLNGPDYDFERGTYRLPLVVDKVLRPGAFVEVEVQDDPQPGKPAPPAEWVPAKVLRVLEPPGGGECGRKLEVEVVLLTSTEKGKWTETYGEEELGSEWRWPVPRPPRR